MLLYRFIIEKKIIVQKIGIVGATGYTGVELLRILAVHPQICVHAVTSRSNVGTRVDAMFPNLRGFVDNVFVNPDDKSLFDCDLVFFATPNGVAMKGTQVLLDKGIKVIDLAADYRIKDLSIWKHWYGMEHASPDLVESAVYGLPELNRAQIKDALLVANPGCYPTAVTLGLLPLVKNGIADFGGIIADCKSGASGAGRGANVGTLLCEAGDSFKAYNVGGHRHQPEIAQTLSLVSGEEVDFTFVPHLLPMIRGIHATIYTKVLAEHDLQSLYEDFYKNEAFVDVLPAGQHPETRSVKTSNTCRMAVHRLPNSDKVVVLSVIDNLVKGAAGQAVQNMNLMLGLEEILGINVPGVLP
ncbi:MAG: N-acetyl-gamma-glutamyl-phosphate reductase (EC [uncultured Thiotrichaceae bacterium]|uniref:N-acetyl-gamma-glutamyl-phosphate reductase n=1 Tax=uncultured Thiotrichaceae bacterium TaxID=298394 RepID=A0A6S6T383_9GAMM|nr:MAG: N-acetyl-gamma-glutamyl-phosphate reductase (EC [uncultured Thiotrichaceae bacterium]